MRKYRDNICQNSFSSLILHLNMTPYRFSGTSALGKRSKVSRPLPHCNLLIFFFKQLIDFLRFSGCFSSLQAAVLACSITAPLAEHRASVQSSSVLRWAVWTSQPDSHLLVLRPPRWLPKAERSVLAPCTRSCCLAVAERSRSFTGISVGCNVVFWNPWLSIQVL